MKKRLTTIVVLCLILPSIFWFDATNFSQSLIDNQSPPGQGIYILSKLAGLYAAILAAIQVIFGFTKHLTPKFTKFSWNSLVHRNFGLLVVFFLVTHVVLFLLAKSIRSGQIEIGYLAIDFNSGYYRGAISLGAIGLYSVLIAAFFGLTRKHMKRAWMHAHKIAPIGVCLGIVHALLIGSEAKSDLLAYFYVILGLLVIALIVLRLFSYFRVR